MFDDLSTVSLISHLSCWALLLPRTFPCWFATLLLLVERDI
jgi:hypothetical protein